MEQPSNLHKRVITFMLHLSFLVILSGALITHIWGVQGALHLRVGEEHVEQFVMNDGMAADLLLLLSIVLFFFQKNSGYRALFSHSLLKRGVAIVAIMFGGSFAMHAEELPRTLSKEVAERFGELYVYHNDRICPMQTLAIEFTSKIYGKPSYKGLTAEQVLTGWFFYYDSWKNEPMIKIKGGRGFSYVRY